MENSDSILHELGKRIKTLRMEKGFNVPEFALATNIKQQRLTDIEKGMVDVKLSAIMKIANALEIKPEDLLDL